MLDKAHKQTRDASTRQNEAQRGRAVECCNQKRFQSFHITRRGAGKLEILLAVRAYAAA